MPYLERFSLNPSALGKHIYRDYPHQTTTVGLVVESVLRAELAAFLAGFLRFVGGKDGLFLRVDAFVGHNALTIIEINVELQDGWGVALNLLRASGHGLQQTDALLPKEIVAYSDDYLPEFELAKDELARLGRRLDIVRSTDRPTSVMKSPLDDKLHLARFSREWTGSSIRIPPMFRVETTPWDRLPEDVVFKFREKYGDQAQKARYSVVRRRDMGKGKFVKACYNDGSAVAQTYAEPMRLEDGSGIQAIILCTGAQPVTGYLQVAPPSVFVINDKTASKGPLILE